MNVQLSDHFNYRRLLRFILPSIITPIFSVFGGRTESGCVLCQRNLSLQRDPDRCYGGPRQAPVFHPPVS